MTFGHFAYLQDRFPCCTCRPSVVYTMSKSGNGHSRNKISLPFLPVDVHFAGLQNLLRLRTDYKYNNRLAAEIGADFNIQQQSVFPAAILQYEVCSQGQLKLVPQLVNSRLGLPKQFSNTSMLHLQVVAKNRHWGALQATTQGLNFRKTFTIQRKQASCSVTGKLGYSFEGLYTMSCICVMRIASSQRA